MFPNQLTAITKEKAGGGAWEGEEVPVTKWTKSQHVDDYTATTEAIWVISMLTEGVIQSSHTVLNHSKATQTRYLPITYVTQGNINKEM